jgi:spermidine synthase
VSAAPDRLRRTSVVLLFFVSGFCNLVYEVVWTRLFNLFFGVTVFAVSAVLTSFMLGLACGGILVGRFADRAREPLRLFAWLHVALCVSTVALLAATPALREVYVRLHATFGANVPVFRGIVFVLALAALIVPTTLMGATFPVSLKALTAGEPRIGRDVGTLYSLGTLGSVVGCVTTVAILLELAGMRGTVLIAAFTDLAIGAAALAADRLLARGDAAR